MLQAFEFWLQNRRLMPSKTIQKRKSISTRKSPSSTWVVRVPVARWQQRPWAACNSVSWKIWVNSSAYCLRLKWANF